VPCGKYPHLPPYNTALWLTEILDSSTFYSYVSLPLVLSVGAGQLIVEAQIGQAGASIAPTYIPRNRYVKI
ncbi:MAG: hypothetical protein ACYSWY_08245, partial [Planctomycetota bacterium]